MVIMVFKIDYSFRFMEVSQLLQTSIHSACTLYKAIITIDSSVSYMYCV